MVWRDVFFGKNVFHLFMGGLNATVEDKDRRVHEMRIVKPVYYVCIVDRANTVELHFERRVYNCI